MHLSYVGELQRFFRGILGVKIIAYGRLHATILLGEMETLEKGMPNFGKPHQKNTAKLKPQTPKPNAVQGLEPAVGKGSGL